MLIGDLSQFDPANCEPGIYPSLSYEQFDSIDAVRPTYVQKWMEVCTDGTADGAAAVKWAIDHDESTDATDFGSAFHTRCLEFDLFDGLYAFRPQGIDRRTKVGKAKWAEFVEQAGDKTIINSSKATPDPRAAIEGMANNVRNHKYAGPLTQGGQAEATIVWVDKHSTPSKPVDILCKTRIDFIKGRVPIDLKSAINPSTKGVTKAASTGMWRIQAAMAWDGLKALNLTPERYVYVVVGKKEPWLVNVLDAQWEFLEAGRALYHYVLPLINTCRKTGNWPGYADFDINDLLLAPWDT